MSVTLYEELLAAAMQKLTFSQQASVVKFAKNLAKQNVSKSTKTVNHSALPANTTTPKENTTDIDTRGSGDGGTDKYRFQKSELISDTPKVAVSAEELGETCPTCQRSFDTAKLKQHMLQAHQSEVCDICHTPVKLIEVEDHKWGHIGWATFTKCKAPNGDHDLLPPGPNNTGRYDSASGVRIFQGGLSRK